MKNYLLLTALSLTLTACADGTNGTDGTGTDGANGTASNTHIVNPLGVIGTDTSTTPETATFDANNASFSALTAKAMADNTPVDVTLQGTAVMQTNSANQTQLSRLVSPTFNQNYMPAVTLRFAADGTISATALYADKTYTDISVDNTMIVSKDIFGFTNGSDSVDANYMAIVLWNDTNLDGMMLVGFETDETALPTISLDTKFTGQGKGKYRNFDDASQTDNDITKFTAIANVNFAERTLDFSTSNTHRTGDNTLMPHLDFISPTVNFTDNSISTDIIAGSLLGKLDARFYGENSWEFGGTFALNDANNSYYGVFGAARDGIDLSTQRAYIENIDVAVKVTHEETISTEYASFLDAHVKSILDPFAETTITMNALAVYGDIRTDYARTNAIASLNDGDITPSNNITRLSNAAASMTFASFSGNILPVRLYLDNGKPYETDEIGTDFKVDGKPISGAPDDADSATLTLRRGGQAISIFGYHSDNIAYIDWAIKKENTDLTATNTNLIDGDYDIAGMMVAGVETATLIDTGKTTFTGAGRGYLHSVPISDRINVKFTINADIDFSNKSIELASTASRQCNDDFATCTQSNSLPIDELNFETKNPIIYDGNNISGAIKTTDPDTSFTGIADARFYGASGAELAGSFAMTDAMSDGANNQYYGVFGSQLGNNYTIIESETATTHEQTPLDMDINDTNLTGFNDPNRGLEGYNTLKVDNLLRSKNDNNSKTITLDAVTGAAVYFGYDGADFSSSGEELILYFDDRYYEAASLDGTAITAITNSVIIYSPNSTMGISISSLQLHRGSATVGEPFGFTGNYMALMHWQEAHANYTTSNYGIVGYETLGNLIPKINSASFSGEGQGAYNNKTVANATRYFTITANVDFGTRQVGLTSSETCSSTLVSKICDGDTSNYHLNFTGTLSYERDGSNTPINAVTGTIKTAGTDEDFRTDDGTELHGTADAKFYGTGTDAATEFGGTFSISNNEAGYVGYFGAR